MSNERKRPNIILGITGSIAAVKGPELALLLHNTLSANVIIITTKTGQYFWDNCSQEYNPTSYSNVLEKLILGKDILSNTVDDNDCASQTFASELKKRTKDKIVFFTSQDEWLNYKRIGDPVLHILLRDWCTLLLIAPLSANTLSKLSNGLCDDTLSCIVRAWDFSKPMLVAPAMNTYMWNHRITMEQLKKLESFFQEEERFCIVYPQGNKVLACGEVGIGAMADLASILESVQTSLSNA